MYIYINKHFLAPYLFSDLPCCISTLTPWTIIKELVIRSFLISWEQKMRVKQCYVDLSSWYGFQCMY